MKLKHLFLGGLVCLLLSLKLAHALTLGPTIYRACPHCKNEVTQYTIGSGNTIGARWWTDGYRDAPMLPYMASLVKCAHCQGLFWMEDARELGRIEFMRFYEVKNAKLPLAASEADYLAAAAVRGLTRERELYARQQAWWLANNPAREAGKPDAVWTEARTNNLHRLSTLLDDRNDCERLLQAEIARELGRFADCLQLLARPVSKDCADTARQITELAKQGKARVAELLPEDSEGLEPPRPRPGP